MCAICAPLLGGVEGIVTQTIPTAGLPPTRPSSVPWRRRNAEEIYSYVEALQPLADMAWPFMDHHAKEDMVMDQFL